VTGFVVATKLRIPNTPSMPLDRLDSRLDAVWQHRLALVVAPAGSGKTTLLSRLAARAAGPVAWYRAEGWDGDEESLLRHLEAALAPALDGITRGWSTVEACVNALESWTGPRALLVVDDLYTLHGTPAEKGLERLIDYAPDSLRFAIATRVPPSFNLSRLRLSGDILELSSDDLRFRSWEVERLFRDFYAEPLPPEELARLARRTEGWAAGLQLFHLATRGRPADERRRILAELGSGARLMREYLASNVLHQLPTDLRRFLVDTSVLGRLSGPLCDQYLNSTGSAEILADLEQRRLFTQSVAEDGVYRYHEILRSYLHAALLQEVGEEQAHARFRAAAELLVTAGAVPEALEAYCRAEDWDGARRLLVRLGEAVAERPSEWVDALPAAMVMHDPWLLLASARRLRIQGRIGEAIERFQLAETAFGTADTAMIARHERQSLAIWHGHTVPPQRPDTYALLRAALRRDPASASRLARQAPEPASELVAGLADLVAGRVATARGELIHAAERMDASSTVVVIASLAAAVAGALMGQAQALFEIEGAVAAAESAGLDWLSRVGRAALSVTGAPDRLREADAISSASAAIGDEWGAALARLCASWGALVAGRDVTDADPLVIALRSLDAPVLEAWSRGIAALAGVRAGEPEARTDALGSESVARSTGADGPRLLAHLALSEAAADPIEAADHQAAALAIAYDTGIRLPVGSAAAATLDDVGKSANSPNGENTSIRLLGEYELRLAGRDIDLASVRPRARALLRLLSLNVGRRVHHETIEAALWPDADADSSARNLHVAVAALRRALEPAAGRGSFQVLRRDGGAYLLNVPPGSFVDVIEFERTIVAAGQARQQSDRDTAARLYRAALSLYRGELLPEDGPAEWLAERRDALHLAAVGATQALAEVLLEQGQAADAARTCSVGLQLERYHDPLWRLLITARDRAGDQGAAMAARHGYDRMLAELGVTPAAASSSPP
jgi:DNA-binding SARP family transcriptional activator